MTDIKQIERDRGVSLNPVELLIYQSVRFANWAAGEGISPVDGEEARAPDEFFLKYSEETGDEDWETLAFRLAMESRTDMRVKCDALTAERDALRAALISVLDVISEESGWGTWRRMEGSEIYNDANKARETARAALEKGTDT